MFEKLFKSSHTVARHESAPYVEERRRFLIHLAQEGYPKCTLMRKAIYVLSVARRLRGYGDVPISQEQIKVAIDRRTMPGQRTRGRDLSMKTIQNIRGIARQWLIFIGRFYKPKPISATSLRRINDFAVWMEHERGFSPRTINQRCRDAEYFLEWYEVQGRPLTTLQIQDIDSYLAKKGAVAWSRITVSNQAHALKVFFRYAGQRGWCDESLADAIRYPRVFFQEALPVGPTWQDVQRLISRLDTDRPHDVRDRAAVMLLAIYGLRVTEVSRLRLEDIDWEHDLISVSRPKQRRAQTYPLSAVVGEAIVRYLKMARPISSRQEVFLTFKAPLRPITQGILYQSISKHMMALGIHPPHTGPHSLRHACAKHLVQEGFSLKEIGDHLGHRSSISTRIYAKVDLPALRTVAAFDLGGLA